ncbi:ROK family protein [Bacillus sp. CGMCC 1.16607]|uniref:ROK family protein n=1 Tax=Bacillus sp. CGMCC 1.16607 TaxID=3351842 RepID=UPI003642EC99
MEKILVADIGGTKIAAALADKRGKLTCRLQVNSATHESEAMFTSLLSVFSNVLERENTKPEEIQLIGLGVPGLVDSKKGLAVYQNNLPWRNFPLISRLKVVYPNAKIAIDNDVYMAAWGEWKARQLDKETFVYITISTGISACIINNGQFIRGAGMAGEIGFAVVNYNQLNLTLETLASGPALKAEAKQVYNNAAITTERLLELYNQDDPKAAIIVRKAARNIARGLHQLITVLDPHVVTVGGGVINHQPQFFELIKHEVQLLTQNPIQQSISERIQASYYKGDAGLQGARYRAIEGMK